MATGHGALRLGAAVAVALAAVIAMASPASAGGGCHLVFGDEQPTEATGSTVRLQDMCMTPTVLRVAPGTDVTFVNGDMMSHNLYGAGGLAVPQLTPGQSVVQRYDREGTYPFACTIHVGMVGAIVVGEGRGDTSAVQPVAVTQPIAASTASTDTPPPSDSTALVVVVSVVLTLVVGGLGFAFGRRSAVSG